MRPEPGRVHRRRGRHAFLLFLALALTSALLLRGPARARPQGVNDRVAVVVGISLYDADTGVPDLPQLEASARDLGNRLTHLPGYDASRVRVMVHRVTRSALLDGIRSAAAAATSGDSLLVALLCAGDRGGLLASDGRIRSRDLRDAIRSTPARAFVVLVDAASSVALDLRSDDPRATVLCSACTGQEAWPVLMPAQRGRVDYLSAAAAGWARATRLGSDGRMLGALAGGRCLTVEDLDLAARQTVATALPANQEGRLVLDAGLGAPVLDAIMPAMMTRLRRRGSIPMAEVRPAWPGGRFSMLAGVLAALGSERVHELGGGARGRLRDAVRGRSGWPALRRLHRELLQAGLLETPPASERDAWRRLVRQRTASGAPLEVAVVTPLRQEGRISGEKDGAVAGPTVRCNHRLAYGSYDGSLDGHAAVRIHLQIFGTSVSGRWEGWFRNAWLRGAWQGRYDPRSGRVEGQGLSALGSASAQTKLPARFEGTVDGRRVRGSWRSLLPPLAGGGRWTVHK